MRPKQKNRAAFYYFLKIYCNRDRILYIFEIQIFKIGIMSTNTRLSKILIALLIVSAAYLNGCLNYYQETKLKTDGSGEMFIHYWMKLSTQQDSLVVTNSGVFNPDSIRSEFSAEHNAIENVEVYTDSTDSTVHAKIELTFNSIDSLNTSRAFRGASFSLKDGAANQKIFSQFIPPAAGGFGVNAEDFTLTYVYYLPGDIITHNASEISGNKLTWKYKLSEIGTGKTITATFRPFKLKETPVWIYGLALFVLVLVIVFLFRKNRS